MIYSVCFPVWSSEIESPVQQVRREHDPQFKVLAPHFTLAFGADVKDEPAYVEHASRAALAAVPFHFALRHAALYFLGKGPAHALLLPDEGLSHLARLHDALYVGMLEPFLRLDMPFVPHMTMASSSDARQVNTLCRAWNRRGLVIEGKVQALTVGRLRAERFEVIATLPLGAA